MSFPFYKQLNAMDCGPTCLRMVAKHYCKYFSADTLRRKMGYSKDGVSLLGISETAESIGFRTRGVQISFDQLKNVPLPTILHWNQNHFVVLVAIRKRNVTIADPGSVIRNLYVKDFWQQWESESADNSRRGRASSLT
ncbi:MULTISPECIES: cysteine peptidase family C39 domain-containing protein [Chitinophagaceae]